MPNQPTASQLFRVLNFFEEDMARYAFSNNVFAGMAPTGREASAMIQQWQDVAQRMKHNVMGATPTQNISCRLIKADLKTSFLVGTVGLDVVAQNTFFMHRTAEISAGFAAHNAHTLARVFAPAN